MREGVGEDRGARRRAQRQQHTATPLAGASMARIRGASAAPAEPAVEVPSRAWVDQTDGSGSVSTLHACMHSS
eukprot:359576-Chlamydomonas_euryale.AAC.2